MFNVKQAIIAAVVSAAALMPGTAIADDGILGTSVGGTCNGSVDISCVYCSYQGGNVGQPLSRCYNGTFGYYWLGCYVWVGNNCVIG